MAVNLIYSTNPAAIIFAYNPPAVPPPTPPPPRSDIGELDQGVQYQSVNVNLGPSLGWVKSYVLPGRIVNDDTTLGPEDSVIFVDSFDAIEITLPEVAAWVKEPHYQPYNNFERSLWIKDMAGFAPVAPITVVPFPGQKIDLQNGIVMSTAHQCLKLYPLNNLTGWFVG